MAIKTTKTQDLPPKSANIAGAETNFYNPNSGKDERILLSDLGKDGNVDQITFNPQTTVQQPYELGKMFYDAEQNTWTFYNDIDGVSLQIGEELRARLVNDTGGTLLNGKAVSVTGAVGASLQVELLDASNLNSSLRAYGLMTIDTVNGNPGYAITYGAVNEIDTSAWAIGDILFADPLNPGELINHRPDSPDYPVRIGVVLVSHPSQGVVAVSTQAFTGTDTTVGIEGALNGSAIFEPGITVVVDGGNVYADIINKIYPTEDLPFLLSDVRYKLNTTTGSGVNGAYRVQLTPGTDYETQAINGLYIRLLGGVPTVEVSDTEPPIPFVKLGGFTLSNITDIQNDGAFTYRRVNNAVDLINGVNDGALGILTDTLDAFRDKLPSNWISGQVATPEVNNTTIRYTLTAGTARQFRLQSLPAFNGLEYWIFNDITNTIVYDKVDNLTAIIADATGGTLLSNNTFYTIRTFFMLNSEDVPDRVIATRPLGSYGTAAEAISDPLSLAVNYTDTTREEVVYPLYDFVIGRTGGGGTTITLIELTDRRSKFPFASGGGGAAGGGGTDNKVGVTINDTTPTYLDSKTTASDGLTKEVLNPGANEVLNISGKNLPFIYFQFDALNAGSAATIGKFRFNNVVTPINATELYINVTEFGSGQDITEWLNKLKSGSVIRSSNRNDITAYFNATLTGDVTISSGVATLPINVNEYNGLSDDDVLGFSFLSVGGNEVQSIEKTPSTTVSIVELLSHTLPIDQSGIINFVGGTNTFIGGVHQRIINTNGDAINFDSSFFPAFKNDYSALEAGSYYFLFWIIPTNSGNKIGVNISKINEDLTSPELQSATVEDATDNVMNLVFNEAVNITTAGWSLSTDNPTPLNINSVVGSGTAAPDFNLDRSVTDTEVITISYDSGTGATQDLNGNPLADIVNAAVINNVTDLIQLAAPTLNAPTMGGSSAALTWNAITNNSGYDVYYKEQTSGTWIFFETTGIGNELSTVTGLDPATDYDFSVFTKGDGVTYSDSVRSNIVQGTTSAAFNAVNEAYQFLDATILAGADADPVTTLDDQSPNNRDASTVGAATPIIDERTINAQTIKTITLNDEQYAYDLGYNANTYANGDYEVWLGMEILLTTDTPTNPYINFEGARGANTNDRYVIGFANANPFALINNQVDPLKSTTYVAGITGFMAHKVFRYVFNYTSGTVSLYIDNVFISSGDITGYGANMAINVNAYLGAENNNGVAAYRAGGVKTTMYLTRRGLYNKILTSDEANEVFNYMTI